MAEMPVKSATPEEALMVRGPSKVFDPSGVVAMAVVQDASEKAESAMLAVELVTVFPCASRTVTTGWVPNADPAVFGLEGWVVKARVVALPAFTVRFALVATAEEEIAAPTVTAPESTPVKEAVYTPDPAFVIAPKVPVPPTVLEVKAMDPRAGRPEGFEFPKASLVVRVAVIEEPEFTVLEDKVTPLSLVAKAPGATVITLEQSVESPAVSAFR